MIFNLFIPVLFLMAFANPLKAVLIHVMSQFPLASAPFNEPLGHVHQRALHSFSFTKKTERKRRKRTGDCCCLFICMSLLASVCCCCPFNIVIFTNPYRSLIIIHIDSLEANFYLSQY